MTIPLGNAHLTKGGITTAKENVVKKGNESLDQNKTRSLADRVYPKKADSDRDGY